MPDEKGRDGEERGKEGPWEGRDREGEKKTHRTEKIRIRRNVGRESREEETREGGIEGREGQG